MIPKPQDGNPPASAPFNEKSPTTSPPSSLPLTTPQDPSLSLRTSNSDEYIYPEGGFTAWLVVLGAFSAMFASLGIANTLATFQAYISQNQLSSYSPSKIGWIFSLYAFLSFACGIYVGPLFDVYGPRWLIVSGSACVVGSMFLLGVCTGMFSLLLIYLGMK